MSTLEDKVSDLQIADPSKGKLTRTDDDLSDLNLSPATLAVHAADHLNPLPDVAPPIHVTTTFRYSQPLVPEHEYPEEDLFAQPPRAPHFYSRLTTPSSTALETTLTALLGGHATVFSSGLSAFFALMIHLNPKRLLLSDGYHGVHGIADMFKRLTGLVVIPLTPAVAVQAGDLVHLETPENPHGTAHCIAAYAKKAHDAGAVLSIDSTFAPPPLQDALADGADWVMHSATKYFGGHSDMLGGVLVTRDVAAARKLKEERLFTGSVMGGLESWLGARSLKTLELRITRQSENATRLVEWLKGQVGKGVVKELRHASLQEEGWVKEQMKGGYPAVFSMLTEREEQAKGLATGMRLWIHATSLGGVESLVEWRTMSDGRANRRLLRFSVGVEAVEDLRADLERGLAAVKDL